MTSSASWSDVSRGVVLAVSGDLVITSLTSLVPRMVPLLSEFQRKNPEVVIRYLTGTRLFRLEYGEAHVAIRTGSPPSQPDNVVQALSRQRMGLFASRRYVDDYGLPKTWADCVGHRFVGTSDDQSRAPFNNWIREKVPEATFSFRSDEDRAIEQAILSGAGIGFASILEARANPDLVEVFPPEGDEWSAALWLVTHVDLHRTTKVQAFLTFLKAEAKGWDL